MLLKESIIESASAISTSSFVNQRIAKTNKERFDNIATILAGSVWSKHDLSQTVKYMIEIIVDYLNYNQAVSSFENIESIVNNSEILFVYHMLEQQVLSGSEIEQLDRIETIAINEIPILLCPWKGHRIVDNMYLINEENQFDGNAYFYNVHNTLVKPLNILICSGGNHSQFAAIKKNSGTTVIDTEYDMRGLYERIEFDGKGYKQIGMDDYLQIDANEHEIYYSGILFELGRILLQ